MPSGRTNNFSESRRGLGHVTPTIFGSTVGYPGDSLASCHYCHNLLQLKKLHHNRCISLKYVNDGRQDYTTDINADRFVNYALSAIYLMHGFWQSTTLK